MNDVVDQNKSDFVKRALTVHDSAKKNGFYVSTDQVMIRLQQILKRAQAARRREFAKR
ncbi:MAG: hypothetical protein ACRCV9_06400 [Burkholderiaceae bacterium]